MISILGCFFMLSIKPIDFFSVKQEKRREMYNKDERFIKKNFGKEEHFRVPKDYFDTLAPRVLSTIKNKTQKEDNIEAALSPDFAGRKSAARTISMSIWHRYRAIAVSAAASVLIGGFALGAWVHGGGHPSGAPQTPSYSAASSSNLDAMMNYSMMDTEEMYSYIADAE